MPVLVRFLKSCVEAFRDSGVVLNHVGGLARIGFEVVEFGDFFPLVVLAGDGFPAATANRDGIGFAVTEDEEGFAFLFRFLAEENGEEAEGVLRSFAGELDVVEVGGGG